MVRDAAMLPETTEELKAFLLEREQAHEESRRTFEKRIRELTNQLLEVSEELALFRHKEFGRQSEKLTPADELQGRLFDEAEQTSAEEQETQAEETVPVAAHTRKKSGRKPLPENLPQEEVVHDIPEEEKTCRCGAALSRIGQEEQKELKLIPARLVALTHIRPKYACRSCEGSANGSGEPVIKIAPVTPKLIPRSIASDSLLSYIAVSKFCDGLPFARQEKQFARIGVDISRQDMSNWMIAAGRACAPLIDLLQKELRTGPVVGIDETPVQVHGEPGRENTSQSRMWVFRGGPPESPVLLYQYHPTRSGEVPLKYLSGYTGYIQTDDYGGYDALAAESGIIHVGCWAHARRKFVDAKHAAAKAGSADIALSYISKLYVAEKELRSRDDLLPYDFARARRRAVVPVLRAFRDWYRKRLSEVPPQPLIGKALNYLHHEWPKLIRYLLSPFLTPDNNAVERAIRPFVVGRKAWLFSGSPGGAFASAALYSLIETAKSSGLEPYLYLHYIFSKLPFATTEEDFIQLLPKNIDRTALALFLSQRR